MRSQNLVLKTGGRWGQVFCPTWGLRAANHARRAITSAMTILKWLAIAVVLGYGGLLALMYVFPAHADVFPRCGAPAAGAGRSAAGRGSDAYKATTAKRCSPGTCRRARHKPLVIYFQGNAGGLNLRADRFSWLTADGTGLLALRYRGYGGSTGKPSEDGLIRDARAAYDFAGARNPAKRIVLFGESLGTAVAVALAAEREVGGRDPRCAVHLRRRCRRRRLSVRAGALADQGYVALGRAHRARVGAAPGAAWRARPHRADFVWRAAVRAGPRAQAHGAFPARRPRQPRRPWRGQSGEGISGRNLPRPD